MKSQEMVFVKLSFSFISNIYFYFSICALCCLIQMQVVSVCSISLRVTVGNNFKRSTLLGSYCTSGGGSVFLKLLLCQWCSFYAISPSLLFAM